MKRISYILGVWSMCMMYVLTGCREEEKPVILQEAPILYVSDGKETLAIQYGMGSWHHRVDGAEWGGYEADSSHPLMWQYQLGKNILVDMGEDISLRFDVPPLTLQVSYWDAALLGAENADENGTDVEIKSTEAGKYKFQWPEAAGSICVVYAVWEHEDYNGNVSYAFMAGRAPSPSEDNKDMKEEGGKDANTGSIQETGFFIIMKETEFTCDAEQIPFTYSNTTDVDYEYGNIMRLEYQTDGKWTEVPFKEGIGFCGVGNLLKSGTEAEGNVQVQLLYNAPLSSGRYRLSIPANPSEERDKEQIVYSPEFVIK